MKKIDPVARFNAKWVLEPNFGCWVWTAYIEKGYGRIWVDKNVQAHRFSWEVVNGPVPDGLELDHYLYPGRCVGGLCVNPDHVRPVTGKENTLRSSNPCALNARKTHCKRGHPLTGSNVRVRSKGQRM